MGWYEPRATAIDHAFKGILYHDKSCGVQDPTDKGLGCVYTIFRNYHVSRRDVNRK